MRELICYIMGAAIGVAIVGIIYGLGLALCVAVIVYALRLLGLGI